MFKQWSGFLLATIINAEFAKTETSFLKIPDKY